MVNLKYTSDIVLTDNIFMNGGGCGVVSQPTSTHNQINGNYFYNIVSNAISLGTHESYMSDVAVINSNFESGDFSGWNNAFGCTVTDSEKRGGNYAALLQGKEGSSCLVRELDVKPETEYACSFWYNGENPLQCSVQTAYGTVIAKDIMEQMDVDWIAMWTRTGGWDWKGSGLQFESGSNSKLYFVMENTSVTDVYVDDFNYDILKHYIETYGASSHDTVSNNYIENCASVYRDGCGIFALHPQHLKIVHNEIFNMPYTGIGMGWAWDESITDSYGFMRNTHNNEIAYNRIYEVAQLLDDGAGVYILGRSDNTVVHHNYISDIHPSDYYGSNPVGGIRFDNGSMNKTAEYNVLDKVAMSFYAYNAPKSIFLIIRAVMIIWGIYIRMMEWEMVR